MNRPTFDTKDSPWLLTHISGRWRVVALSTPSLWSRLAINCFHQHANPFGRQTTPRRQVEMFWFLSEHSARWEELNLEFKLMSAILPQLENLQNCV
ncbi:hypothetical protein B0H17DRAFT_1030345 [Mycena rosella]|uniref:Uncharacterized protein n=1 Tax=Mycena rosella TaxID=1033263 RepID=A0AAD7GZV6_MYCRO|nr:hypothetical protein B0H17DRAFT_1030345 [Mycena rosella]